MIKVEAQDPRAAVHLLLEKTEFEIANYDGEHLIEDEHIIQIENVLNSYECYITQFKLYEENIFRVMKYDELLMLK